MDSRAPLTAALAATSLLALAPTALAAPDRKADLGGAKIETSWDGGPVTGTPLVGVDDDDTLITVAEAGRLTVTTSDASAEAADVDLEIYRSDASGEPKGEPIVVSQEGASDEKAAKDVPAGMYLVRVLGFASVEGTYKGKATLVAAAPATPAPTPAPAPGPAPSPSPAPPAPAPADKTPTAKLGKLPKTKRNARFLFKGTASDDRGVARVEVAIVRQGTTCRQLTAKGRFAPVAKCAAPTIYLKAKGTKSWSFRIPKAFPKGSYTIFVRAIDKSGQAQAGFSPSNKRAFKVA